MGLDLFLSEHWERVDRAVIERNSVIDSRQVALGAGANRQRTAAPRNSVMRANLLQKNEQVRARVEAMIGRLKAMDQGT